MAADQLAAPLKPASDLTIMHAEALREAWLGALSAYPEGLALDLGDVQVMDSAGVQLLLALRTSLARRGHNLHIAEASASVSEVLHTYGLQALLSSRKDHR